jgi:hypothetical protein
MGSEIRMCQAPRHLMTGAVAVFRRLSAHQRTAEPGYALPRKPWWFRTFPTVIDPRWSVRRLFPDPLI